MQRRCTHQERRGGYDITDRGVVADGRRDDAIGQGGRIRRRKSICIQGHTLRPRRAVHAAAGSREVGGHTQQPRIRADMSAGRARRLAERRALVRIRLGRRTSRRGLSEGQHLDSGAGRRQEAPRYGLAARRRLRCGQRAGAPLVRRRQPRPQGRCGGRNAQPPSQRPRLHCNGCTTTSRRSAATPRT